MPLVDRWRSLNEETRYFILGVLSSSFVAKGPAVYELIFGGLQVSTQVILAGIVAVGAISLWSTRQISRIESQFERYFSLLIRSQVHLARIVDNTDGNGPPKATDGGTSTDDHPMTGTETTDQFNTGAAFAGALVASSLFAAVTLGIFGEFVGESSLVLVVIAGVGGVLGAYGGNRVGQRKHSVERTFYSDEAAMDMKVYSEILLESLEDEEVEISVEEQTMATLNEDLESKILAWRVINEVSKDEFAELLIERLNEETNTDDSET